MEGWMRDDDGDVEEEEEEEEEIDAAEEEVEAVDEEEEEEQEGEEVEEEEDDGRTVVDIEDDVEEDYNAAAEEQDEMDLFDSDDEEYHKTKAVSAIKPPRPPPPTNFPKRQDYREASGFSGRQGGRGFGGRRDGGGGRGGRFGDRDGDREQDRFGGGHHKRQRNNDMGYGQGFGSAGGDGGRHGQNDKVVDSMRLGPSGHNDPTLRLKCPPFQEPSQLACFSRTSDGNVHWDDRCLRRFREGVLSETGADLNEGYESYVEKREDGAGSGFGDLLACLRSRRISLDNIHFVTFRNNLNKILGTAYNRRDPWEMGVHKRFGTIYLDVHKLPEKPATDQQRRRISERATAFVLVMMDPAIEFCVSVQLSQILQQSCYWGYSFEQLATEDRNGAARFGYESSTMNGSMRSRTSEDKVVDANVEFCAVLRTKLGPHRIIMGAEMDCYEAGRDGRRSYVELKTSRELEQHNVDNFERNKLLKYWIQSFLAGVPRIACGFRDDNGVVVQTELMSTKDITQRVKQKHFWEGGVCLAFADQVFCWLYGIANDDEDYLLRFVPGQNRLELLKADACPETVTRHLDELSGNL